MILSAKDRKLMKQEALSRLEFLVSSGLNTNVYKKYKSTGRVYVNEMITSDWADRNGKKNCTFPRSYVFMDTIEEVTEDMIETKLRLENEGYLVYLVTRERRNSPIKENCTDRIEYFVIDTPVNKFAYPAQDSRFREGFAKVYMQDITNNQNEFTYVNYKVRLEQVIIKEDE